ncbi:MAG: 6-carboxytetrahydropterin synthase [Planctomycetes bacterium]|nr:6-carboxytetrahydropterin synthase [Planctomycetota bacterium]
MPYELSVDREFCAAHALVIAGQREPVHGHNWHVTLVVAGDALDGDGLLCDFHLLERELDDVLAPLDNADLNATPPFDEVNPTAEHVARHIAEQMRRRLAACGETSHVHVVSASVTEAPGCRATYRP